MLILDKFPKGNLEKDEEGKFQQIRERALLILQMSDLSASFPENTDGLGSRAKGRTWT